MAPSSIRHGIRRLVGERAARAIVQLERVMLGDDLPARVDDMHDRAAALGGHELRARYPRAVARQHDGDGIEFRVCSQNGEDGVIAWLFHLIGVSTATFVEFACGNGRENNTANLALNFGWSGTVVEGDAGLAGAAERYYARVLPGRPGPVRVRHAFVTTANVDALVRDAGSGGDVDFMSIDIDGNDFWAWRAVTSMKPRVVAVEYNASIPAGLALTVPYDPAFDIVAASPERYYHGASLDALTRLGRAKGYRLVAVESAGVNAFFVRNDTGGTPEELDPRSAYRPHRERSGVHTPARQWELIASRPWWRWAPTVNPGHRPPDLSASRRSGPA